MRVLRGRPERVDRASGQKCGAEDVWPPSWGAAGAAPDTAVGRRAYLTSKYTLLHENQQVLLSGNNP